MCPPKPPRLADPLPPPEKTAEPGEIGGKRKAEDKTLFGGVPDLRTATNTALVASTGLRPGASGMGVK